MTPKLTPEEVYDHFGLPDNRHSRPSDDSLFESLSSIVRADAERVRVLSIASRRIGMLFALRQAADVVRAEIGKGSTVDLEALAKRIELLKRIPMEEIV